MVLYCDIENRADFASDHLPQDLLYLLTLYLEGIGNAIRTYGGTLCYLELDSICALFGLDGTPTRASQQALRRPVQSKA